MSALIEAAAGRTFRSLELPEAEVIFCPDFFPAADADRLLRELLETTSWRQEVFRMYGREVPFPRLMPQGRQVASQFANLLHLSAGEPGRLRLPEAVILLFQSLRRAE
jgi:hypothetical protein